ncbi:MAG: RluA family pseudouridine synthase [Thermodesulfobacteriota bacterium]
MNQELKLLHLDPHVIVVVKPGGLLSVPGRGKDKQDCVTGRIRSLFTDTIRQPAVHRLDMDTSGLMVLARTREAHRSLSIDFQEKRVKKVYVALVEGRPQKTSGRIMLRFRLDPDNRPCQILDPHHGKPGVTFFKELGVEDAGTRIQFTPLTGRTHQLRLHAAHYLGLGTPIVGDRLYGSGRNPGELCLHAARLDFHHPVTKKWLEFESSPPF